MTFSVEFIAVGTELLLGQIVNTNASWIGSRLADAGLGHYRQTVVGDNFDRLVAEIKAATGRADAVILSGGLGPTQDDITREAMAAAAGVDLVRDEAYVEQLRGYWASRGREMPESNVKQADHPAGAHPLDNPKGTAPGLRLDFDGAVVFAVPGVPAELYPMFDNHVLPALRELAGGMDGVMVSRVLRSWGESESRIGEMFDDIFQESTNPTVAFLASSGEIKVRLTAWAKTNEEAEALIAPLEATVRERLGHRIFGADGDTIEHVIYKLLRARGWSVGTAESATGGMIASRLTSVPGCSDTFRGAIVAYQEDIKEGLLDVQPATIAQHGVVSEQVAVEMAAGAAKTLDVDVAVSITGSAGPDPQDKPVGTMVIGVHTPGGTTARMLKFPGDRERVRTYTTTAALHHLRLALQGEKQPERWL
ncbi:MAG: competence/damage-inducible protein A [Acidimicrobiia bacterium]|nr:competence/damage-inducible protein A [Acidimicrobiia bacterium]